MTEHTTWFSRPWQSSSRCIWLLSSAFPWLDSLCWPCCSSLIAQLSTKYLLFLGTLSTPLPMHQHTCTGKSSLSPNLPHYLPEGKSCVLADEQEDAVLCCCLDSRAMASLHKLLARPSRYCRQGGLIPSLSCCCWVNVPVMRFAAEWVAGTHVKLALWVSFQLLL